LVFKGIFNPSDNPLANSSLWLYPLILNFLLCKGTGIIKSALLTMSFVFKSSAYHFPTSTAKSLLCLYLMACSIFWMLPFFWNI
jgi:hypothetical protein